MTTKDKSQQNKNKKTLKENSRGFFPKTEKTGSADILKEPTQHICRGTNTDSRCWCFKSGKNFGRAETLAEVEDFMLEHSLFQDSGFLKDWREFKGKSLVEEKE
jgi:hypothetical protein